MICNGHLVKIDRNTVDIHQLSNLAFMARADAVDAYEAGDMERAVSLEVRADKLYDTASSHGVSFYWVPPYVSCKAPDSRECEQCGQPFYRERSTARFCSARCRVRAHRKEAA